MISTKSRGSISKASGSNRQCQGVPRAYRLPTYRLDLLEDVSGFVSGHSVINVIVVLDADALCARKPDTTFAVLQILQRPAAVRVPFRGNLCT